MANYYPITRTNYFHVKDEQQFRDLMNKIVVCDGDLEVWDGVTDENGGKTFGFGGYCSIDGYREDPDDWDADADYEEFITRLSECVAEDDAVIIFEVGNEKLRYLTGFALVVTSTDYKIINLMNEACEEAAKMLKNPNWTTRCDY